MIDKKLKDLHAVLTDELLKRIRDPECKASDLNVARQFLKDNGINVDVEDSPPIMNLVKELPFTDEERKAE